MTTKYRFVIEINENETAISPGDFYRMRQAGKFTMVKIDESDFAKIIGTTADGTIYVSERLDEEMTEKEEEEYYARKGITNDITEHMFDSEPNEGDSCIKELRVY